MFNPADFDALRAAIERSGSGPGVEHQLKAVAVVKDLAEWFNLMAPESAPARPFCHYEGCDQEPVPGSKCGFCEGHEKQERMEEAFYRAMVAHEKGDCTGHEYCVFCKSDDISQQYAMIAERHEAAYRQQKLSEDK